MRLFAALSQDLRDAFHWRPSSRVRHLTAEVEKLGAGIEALQQYTNELEMRLNNDALNSLRLDRLEDQFASLYRIQTDADAKQIGLSSQVIEFGNELEKLRLRLAAPTAEIKDNRPKTWAQQRRELELEYATKSVTAQENADAGKGKPS